MTSSFFMEIIETFIYHVEAISKMGISLLWDKNYYYHKKKI